MTALTEKIYDEVLELPTDERLGLIDKLLESVNPVTQPIQEAWVAEAEKRLQQYRAGKLSALPGQDVFNRIQQRLRK